LLLTVCGKKGSGKDTQNARERLYKRFVFANYDVLKDLDEEEKKIM
jgi:hypothetical protein